MMSSPHRELCTPGGGQRLIEEWILGPFLQLPGRPAVRTGGAGEGNRTPDLFITSESLCRLSYPGDNMAPDLLVYNVSQKMVRSTALLQRLTMLLSRGHATSGEPN